MRLNHLNLPVDDVLQAQAFFEQYFGFQPLRKPTAALALLRGTDGMILALSNFSRTTPAAYHPDFHIGFIQDSPAQVDAFYQRLVADGYQADPPRRMHGSWTFYFRAPGGIIVEIQSHEA